MVCRDLHEQRTRGLYKYIKKNIDKNSNFYLISGFDQFDDIPIVKLSDTDDYLSCIDKTLKIFDYHKDSDFDWYFIGDDDTFVNIPNLLNYISELDNDSLEVFGNKVKIAGKNEFHLYGGSGILMNAKTFKVLGKFIIDNEFKIRDTKHSDISLVYNINKFNNLYVNKINTITIPYMYRLVDVVSQTVDYKKLITLHLKDISTYIQFDKIIQKVKNSKNFKLTFKGECFNFDELKPKCILLQDDIDKQVKKFIH
jgi:hypothetical protein